jgi:hypothetical protein
MFLGHEFYKLTCCLVQQASTGKRMHRTHSHNKLVHEAVSAHTVSLFLFFLSSLSTTSIETALKGLDEEGWGGGWEEAISFLDWSVFSCVTRIYIRENTVFSSIQSVTATTQVHSVCREARSVEGCENNCVSYLLRVCLG